MIASLIEFANLAIRSWLTYAMGGAATLGTFLWERFELAPNLPWWAEGAIIVALAFMGASFQAFQKMREARDVRAPQLLSRDARVEHVFRYLLDNRDYTEPNRYSMIVADIRQAALDGRVALWGRALTHGTPRGPLLLIPSDYWATYQLKSIEIMSLGLKDKMGDQGYHLTQTMRDGSDPLADDTLYCALEMNWRQVRHCWPRMWSMRAKRWAQYRLKEWLNS